MSRGRVMGRLAAGLLVLAMAGSALASTLSDIVPPNGSAAGHPYAYWLKKAWALYFSSPAPGPGPCQTVNAHGATVTLVEDIGGGRSSCHVAPGQPIFVNELSKECSNVPGHHNGYGTSGSALQQCARATVEKALISVYVDGQRLSNFGKYYWKPVSAFSVRVSRNRFSGFHKTRARAAAWGWALLFKGLPKGTHTVRCNARFRNGKPEFSSQITLHVA